MMTADAANLQWRPWYRQLALLTVLATYLCAAEPAASGVSNGGGEEGAVHDGAVASAARDVWRFAGDTIDDLGAFLTAPVRFRATDWAVFGGIVGGTVAAGALLDNHARDQVQAHRSTRTDAFASVANQGGTIVSFVPLAAFGAWSLVDDDHDHHARRVFRDGLETVIIASGIITPTIKLVAGRERPNRDLDSNDDWKPFSGNGSFPSGHTTQAFAVASVLTAEYRRQWWVGPIAYAAAATVGWARMNDNKHYLSDVMAGAAIGTAVGWYVVLREDGRVDQRGVTVSPVIGRDGSAVELAWRF